MIFTMIMIINFKDNKDFLIILHFNSKSLLNNKPILLFQMFKIPQNMKNKVIFLWSNNNKEKMEEVGNSKDDL